MMHALAIRLKSDPRFLRLLKGSASAIAARLTAVAANAVIVPLTLRYLGKEQYGLWITINATVLMLAMLDLGIANTLTNHISRAFAEGSEATAKRFYATAFWATASGCAGAGVVLGVNWHLIPWNVIFRFNDVSLSKQASECAAISVTYLLISLPLTLANKVLGGYQRVPVANAFATVNSVLGLAAMILVIRARGTIVHLMAAYCMAMLTGAILLNLWMALFHRPRILPTLRGVSRGAARELLGHGILFFALQVSGIIIFSSDNFVIAHYLGTAQVTPYSITWRFVSYSAVLQSFLIPSLWPAFSEAYVKAELTWIRSAFRRYMRATFVVSAISALMLGSLGRWMIGVWAAPAAVPSPVLLWCMCFWNVLLSITVSQAVLLAATQRLQIQAISSALAAILNLALSIILVQRIGTIGVLLGTIASYLLLVVVPQTWEVRRILHGTYLNLKEQGMEIQGKPLDSQVLS
jgi:O-antigen/teichoic acid export membrane protein